MTGGGRNRGQLRLSPLAAAPSRLPPGWQALAHAAVGEAAGLLVRHAVTGAYALLQPSGALRSVPPAKAAAALTRLFTTETRHG